MAFSEDNSNYHNNDRELGFQQRGEMSSGSMFNNRFSIGSGNLFGSGWDPLENLGGSSSNHQELLHRYQAGDLDPKLGSFRSGCFSEMVNAECSAERVSETNKNNKRRASHSHINPIKNTNEWNEKKQKTEAKECDNGQDYVHVRAKRGQATNSHSLAERVIKKWLSVQVRRERISERMKLLQDLVPGCNKITGKAMMLDEIINYVQSLQHQVEFLSMKLATVNPEMNIDIDHIMSKDILNSQGSMTNMPPTSSSFPQPSWDNHLHNLLQMGFPSINNLGPNGNC